MSHISAFQRIFRCGSQFHNNKYNRIGLSIFNMNFIFLVWTRTENWSKMDTISSSIYRLFDRIKFFLNKQKNNTSRRKINHLLHVQMQFKKILKKWSSWINSYSNLAKCFRSYWETYCGSFFRIVGFLLLCFGSFERNSSDRNANNFWIIVFSY